MSLQTIATACGRHLSLRGFWSAASVILLLLLVMATPQIAFAQPDPPDPENANPRSATTTEDTTVSIDTGVEFDPRYQVVVVVPGPAHGTVSQGGTLVPPTNFIINYTPGANQVAPVSFSYQICTVLVVPTRCGQSALVTVGITPVNDPPQTLLDMATVVYGQSVLIPVLSNDNGGANESDTATLVSVGSPGAGNGTTAVEGNQVRYTAPALPNLCNPTTVNFTYQAQDSSGNQATGQVSVKVNCPGMPTLKLSEPYGYSGHTFKIDVILDSADVNISAVDFTLNYYQCLTDVDVPTNNQLADDVTTTLPAGSFYFQPADTDAPPAPGALRMIAASTTSPAAILAGPGASATRTIATVQFRATALPGNVICPSVMFDFTFVDQLNNPITGFTSTAGTPTTGNGTPKIITLDATKLNNKPTNLMLSSNKVNENSPWNTFIGKFSATDLDAGDTLSYGFYLPYGNSNGSFLIRPLAFNNDELATGAVGLASGFYSITVGAMDNFGGLITKTFTIEVVDVNAAPNAIDDGNPVAIPAPGVTNINVLLNDNDNGDFPADPACTNCSVVSVTNGSKGIVINQGTNVRYIPTDAKYTGNDVFSYVMTDNDAPNALTDQAKVTVTVSAEVYPADHPVVALRGTEVKLGDCNGSGALEAGDLTSTGLEIFDGDGNLWYDIYKGTRTTFSPRGCNSNQDNLLDAGDIICTAKKIFNSAFVCGSTLLAANANAANLTVGTVSATPGATVQVPVQLSTAGHSVAAAAFAVDFNGDELSFDATDANNDGLPDAVSLQAPDGLLAIATYNADESRIEIVISGLIPPFPLLSDGAVATVNLAVKEGVNVTESKVTLVNSSLGNDEGQSLPLEVTDGAIQIGAQPANRVLLPLIRMQ